MIFYVFELCYMLIMVLMSYRQLFFLHKGKEGSGLLQHPIVLPSCVQVNEGISPLRLYEKLWLKVMFADFL